jgi:hypothetical protein
MLEGYQKEITEKNLHNLCQNSQGGKCRYEYYFCKTGKKTSLDTPVIKITLSMT